MKIELQISDDGLEKLRRLGDAVRDASALLETAYGLLTEMRIEQPSTRAETI